MNTYMTRKVGLTHRILTGFIASVALLLLPAPVAHAMTVQDIVRLEGQGESVLQGFGLVVGLPGTGDSGADLVVARPLANLLREQGNPIENFEELAASRSVAIVVVKCTIPEEGARRDDKFDVSVSAVHNAASLEGGELFLTPLRGPFPGDPVFAIAEGSIRLEDLNATRGRVRGGARMLRDITMNSIRSDGTVSLVINPNSSGWTTSQLLASIINDHRIGLDAADREIAYAVDERLVRIEVPDAELADPANFIADILSIRFDPSLLSLPATVLVNERTGTIIVTAEVEISPVILSHGDLVITTVAQPGAGGAPAAARRWPQIETNVRDVEAAKLQDLVDAFEQLDVPARDRIEILTELHATGRLHAQLVVN